MIPIVGKQFANEAPWDRVIRVVIGVAMLSLAWSGAVVDIWAIAFKLFGWIPLITGLVGWDPIYAFLGIGTKRWRRRGSPDSSKR